MRLLRRGERAGLGALRGVRHGVAVGDGLTAPNPADNVLALAPVTVAPPRLSILKTGGQVQVSWTSDTDRLVLEQTSALLTSNIWTPVTNSANTTASQRKVTLGPSGNRKFYRLHGF